MENLVLFGMVLIGFFVIKYKIKKSKAEKLRRLERIVYGNSFSSSYESCVNEILRMVEVGQRGLLSERMINNAFSSENEEVKNSKLTVWSDILQTDRRWAGDKNGGLYEKVKKHFTG